MAEGHGDHEERLARVEERVEQVAQDAAAARELASLGDRDLAELHLKLDANRKAINALGLQTAGRFGAMDERFDAMDERFGAMDQRFDGIDQRLDAMDTRFDAMEDRIDARFTTVDLAFADLRGQLDRAAAGQEQVVGLLTQLIDRDSGED